MMKIGMLGAGLMGKTHANMFAQIEDAEIISLGLAKPEQVTEMKKKYPNLKFYEDLEAFYQSGIEVVDICLPTFLHKEYIQKTLEHDLDVISEKPLCRTLAEADELLALNQKSPKNVYVAHVLRFFPEYIFLKNAILSQRLGQLKSIYMGRYTGLPDWSVEDWIIKQRLSGGTPLDLQVHDVDFIVSVMGKPDTARTRMRKNGLHIWTQYHYGEDMTVVMEAGNDMPPAFGFEMNYHAVFENGLIRFNSNQQPAVVEYSGGEKNEIKLDEAAVGKLERHLPTGNAYLVELTHFLDCIRKNQPSPYVTIESAAQTIKLILENLPPEQA